MKRHKYIISILILSLSLCFCRKKLFWHVALHGRVLNYVTKAPEQATISVSCNGSPGTKRNYDVGTTTTNSDGTFYLKAQSSRYTPYYIVVSPKKGTLFPKQIGLTDGHDVDVGDFFAGEFTFFCKVTLVPVTTSAIDIDTLHFNAGTSTQFMTHQTKRNNDDPDHFVVGFTVYPGGVPTFSTVTVPTNLSPDTLTMTINY